MLLHFMLHLQSISAAADTITQHQIRVGSCTVLLQHPFCSIHGASTLAPGFAFLLVWGLLQMPALAQMLGEPAASCLLAHCHRVNAVLLAAIQWTSKIPALMQPSD